MSPEPAAVEPRWEARPARDADVDGLLALHARATGKPISRAHWLWKLGARGPAENVWLVERGGRPIFQYAGIPVRFRSSGEEGWAMVSVDTMTDPDFRRRGLLTSVAPAVYAQWREAGVRFVLGMPNENWGSRAAALGWTKLVELRWWVRWLAPWRARVEARARPEPAALEALWRRQPDDGVVRDAAWFHWRYLEATPPWTLVAHEPRGELEGVLTFSLDAHPTRPTARIGEVLASGFSARRAVLARALPQMRAAGAVRAALLIQSGSPLEEAALSVGFIPRAATFSVQGVKLADDLPRAALFHGGDFDVV
jgi:hypothetical protein